MSEEIEPFDEYIPEPEGCYPTVEGDPYCYEYDEAEVDPECFDRCVYLGCIVDPSVCYDECEKRCMRREG